ncbi:Uracil DNA glycosylase superfamily protein [Roseivivax sp. THAF40]|uniref:UdgX family uracil-DNA binding protein n=1 Tax=unclassified Roseivivax TaxID=2639302 RepID=UPI001268316B|nr:MULTISPECIES: UdgX family uracil-DNA binding protein [unclassified Roseivivax]QFS83532.1 Uracil DNA glycosylase superfamily protein [Roseivivax sp. THAF197b]QFT47277.1 Uracil DNA glycosylase superfamily protein [Roseivivax sp. THAF40]
MYEVVLPRIGTVAAWRAEARRLARAGIPPEAVLWRRGGQAPDLFAGAPVVAEGTARDIRLSKIAIDGIESALYHTDPERFARAYRTVLRLSAGAVQWGDRSDADVAKLLAQGKAIGRDVHKMHAFVRFREVEAQGPRRAFAAWFEPEHPCLERGAPFFAKRFGDMDWVIATPDLTARFEDGKLRYEETEAPERPPEDATEDLWRTYYASIFNPARVMVKAMCAEMPKKYWKNLPEAELIPGLIEGAEARVRAMAETMPVLEPDRRARALSDHAARVLAKPAPEGPVATLAEEVRGCTRCDLCHHATQAVPGQGPREARVMIVGEQPGDQEDLRGQPFVGPAGQVFDRAAGAAGLDRQAAFITNAVKHFKFQARGKRRIHQRPDAGEVEACRWWLDLERELVRPELIVAMGATAAEALTGEGRHLTRRRGRIETLTDGTPVLITWHPSYILRLPDADARARAEAELVGDLTIARQMGEAGALGAAGAQIATIRER